MVSLLRDRVLQFLAEYGERGYLVLKAAVEAARSRRSGLRLGDFSYRDVVARLRSLGVAYNPSMLLRILERDYGIVETTYKSSSQHWWKFTDLNAVIEALSVYEEGEEGNDEVHDSRPADPEVELLRIQVAALNLGDLIKTLKALNTKPGLTRRDLTLFSTLAFSKLELVAKLIKRIEEQGLEEELEQEYSLLREVLALASRIARRILERESTQSEDGEAIKPVEADTLTWMR